jgi:hypothetical protein
MYDACLAHFCMWVQYVACLTMVEEEKKDQIHDQNGNEPNRCMRFMDIRGRQNASRVSSLAGEVACFVYFVLVVFQCLLQSGEVVVTS